MPQILYCYSIHSIYCELSFLFSAFFDCGLSSSKAC